MARTRTERRGSKEPQWLAPIAPDQAFKACQPIVEGMAELNGNALMSCLEFNREWTGFLIRRLQQDIALVHNLAKCTEPGDLLSVYSDFYAKAFSDYQREFTQLATLNGKGFEQTRDALQGAVDSISGAAPGAAHAQH